MRTTCQIGAVLFALLGATQGHPRAAAQSRSIPAEPRSDVVTITAADVQTLWDTLRPHAPAVLRGVDAPSLPAAWSTWIGAHDAAIRARVARGDEDSLVNLWLFGTSFTALPPVRPGAVAALGSGRSMAQIADERLADLLTALTSPRDNARLRFAASVLRRRDIDPGSPAGRARARALLVEFRDRMLTENADYVRALETTKGIAGTVEGAAAMATLYSDRGLSADTSILSSFGVDSALAALKGSGMLGKTPIFRIAIVGPGLDFLNKADGHDFYPEQTIQPFAVIDSLLRHGLADAATISVTTFDVSERVNAHLHAARDRASDGYVVQLPLSDAERWTEPLVRYWQRFGERIGDAAPAARAPASGRDVKVRAVRVRGPMVAAITPRDLNVVVERLELPEAERFDLVVATNVFVYYDRFEQALAVTNIARMLRAGGSLLTNHAVTPLPPLQAAVGHDIVAYSDRQFDHLFWYARP